MAVEALPSVLLIETSSSPNNRLNLLSSKTIAMASLRRDSAAASVADHRVRDRRSLSPTSAKPTSRPSSATPSPDKAAHRSTPSYLRATASSRHDSPASSAVKKPALSPAPGPATTPATAPIKKLTRVRSMERHPPAPAPVPSTAMAHHLKMQTSGSLKERPLGVRSTSKAVAGRPVRAATTAAVAAPATSAVAKGRPLKKKEIAACVHDALDVLETRSEPDVVAPVVAGEVEDLAREVVPTSAPTEKDQELDDPPRQIEEQPPSGEQSHPEDPRLEPEHVKEDHKCVEELKDPMLGRPKSFSQVNRGVAVDDELQRKLRRRQAWETEKEGASVVEDKTATEDGGNGELKRKEGSSGSGNNNVIEEAATKLLLEKRKNKVLALVGAFETVMQLQEPETPQHVKVETPRAVAPSAFERELEKTEEKIEEVKAEEAKAKEEKAEEEKAEEEKAEEEKADEEKAEEEEERGR